MTASARLGPSTHHRPEAGSMLLSDEPSRGRRMFQPNGPSSVHREQRMTFVAARYSQYRYEGRHELAFQQARLSSYVKPDLVDKLDTVSELYHHEGPYDAAARERNVFPDQAPIQALQSSNEEALKATPHDMIIDSISEHRPLDGVAIFPPGSLDSNGLVLNYQEGTNMMVEDRGNFQRHPGVKYQGGDLQTDPYYNQEDIEMRRLERKRTRPFNDPVTEGNKSKRPFLRRWKKAFL